MPTPGEKNRIEQIAQKLLPLVEEKFLDLEELSWNVRLRFATVLWCHYLTISHLKKTNAALDILQSQQEIFDFQSQEVQQRVLEQNVANIFDEIARKGGQKQKFVSVIQEFVNPKEEYVLGKDLPSKDLSQVIAEALFTLHIELLKLIRHDFNRGKDDKVNTEEDPEQTDEQCFKIRFSHEIAEEIANLLGIQVLFPKAPDDEE